MGWKTINGNPVYIPGNGTSKGKGGVVALAVGVVVAAGGVGPGGAVTLGGAGVSSLKGSSRAKSSNAQSVVKRLQRAGMRVTTRTDVDDDCAANAYGRLAGWFRDHPCELLVRMTLDIRDRRGAVAVVSVAWVDMPDEASAVELKRIVDTHGTGNIVELSREVGRHRGVRFTGEHYASRRDGATVGNAQAQPAGRGAVVEELAGTMTQLLH